MYTRTSGFSHYQRVFRIEQVESARVCEPTTMQSEAMRRSGVAGEAPAPAGWPANRRRGVAQLAEQRSPKPQVAGSSPVAPAEYVRRRCGPGRPEEEPDEKLKRRRCGPGRPEEEPDEKLKRRRCGPGRPEEEPDEKLKRRRCGPGRPE